MDEAVVVLATAQQERRVVPDILQEAFGGACRVRVPAAGAEGLQLAQQLPFLDQANAGRDLVHPEGERLQDLQGLHQVHLPAGAARQAAGPVPVLEERLDVVPVELHPAVRERDAAALHQRQDGEQQRVRGQGPHSGAGADRRQELPALLLRLGPGHSGFAAHGFFESGRPFAEKGLDLLVVKVHQGGFHQPLRRQPDLAVADDPAGQDEAVARLAVPGVEVPHPVDHQMPAPRVPHLVESVQEKESAPFLESPREQGSERDLDLPVVLVIARDESVERDFPVGQSVGIGGQGEEDGQPPAQSQILSLAGGESQGQNLEEGGLARARVPQEDQAVMLLEEVEHRHRGRTGAPPCPHPPPRPAAGRRRGAGGPRSLLPACAAGP